MDDLMDTIETVRDRIRRSTERMQSIIIKHDDHVDIQTDQPDLPICMQTIYNGSDAQVITAVIKDGTTCARHSHAASIEYFIVLSGSLEMCGKGYEVGDIAIVPAGVEHEPKAVGGDCGFIVILIPPEPAYVGGTR